MYSIFISWEEDQRAEYYIYAITVNMTMNTSAMTVMPGISFEGTYNDFIKVYIEASNSARSSGNITEDVYEGIDKIIYLLYLQRGVFLSAGCSPPSGSGSEFTSSRVGAQVTYSCDTDLVLVGEREWLHALSHHYNGYILLYYVEETSTCTSLAVGWDRELLGPAVEPSWPSASRGWG